MSASAIPFGDGWAVPHALTVPEINGIVAAFKRAAARAVEAGFDVIEVHGAHGYLVNQFFSPISNRREDEYGGSLENRMRMPLRVVDAIREVVPASMPLFFRISAIDYAPGGVDLDQSVEICRELGRHGVDLVDCTAGGVVSAWPLETPGFQVPFAHRIRLESGVATGVITSPEMADEIVRNGRADVVLLGRELLRNPYWPLDAATFLGAEVEWPYSYRRARRAARAVFHG